MNAVINRPNETKSVFALMGKLLNLKLDSETDAVRVVANGITATSYKRVAGKLKFRASLVAPESTIRRRLSTNTRFTEAESERLLRLTRVYAETVELFGSEEAALEWLNQPQTFLPEQAPITPMELAASDSGARLIESHIRRTAHGIF